MLEWQKQIQYVVNVIDESIKAHQDEFLTLNALADQLGYSEFYTARKFKAISGNGVSGLSAPAETGLCFKGSP